MKDNLKQKVDNLKQHIKDALEIKEDICLNQYQVSCFTCTLRMRIDCDLDICEALSRFDTEFLWQKENGG